MSFENEKESKIYIFDKHTLLNQTDLIENCTALKNVVILQTISDDIKKT